MDGGFIDLHCHLLAGLDDGPQSAIEAVELCRQAVSEGCHAVLATAHQRGEYPATRRADIIEAVIRLRMRLEIEKIPLQVLPNAEWLIDSSWFELSDPVAELVTMADGGRYSLLEFPGRCPHHTQVIAERLATHGLQPMLAHVDRYPELLFDPVQVRYLVDDGFIVQMNADTIDGRLGNEPQAAARRLIQAALVHVVASDGHRPLERPIRLRDAFEVVRRWTDDATARLLFAENPQAIVAGNAITKPKAVSMVKRFLKR